MAENLKTVIDNKRRFALDYKELLRNNHLFFYFAWRNFKIRYKQTAIGAAWAILQPVILMIVFTLFFNKVANIGSGAEHVPYPIFAFSALLFWNYFSQNVTQVSNSLLAYQNVIRKIYFPRIIAPISAAFTGLIDMGFAFLVYVGLMFYYHIVPTTAGVLLFLPMVLLTVVTVLGIGLFLAALNIKYRDVAQALPFFVQTMLFVTPVIYPVSLVPEEYQMLLYINPMAGVIETVRASLLSVGPIPWDGLLVSTISAVVMLIFGITYFHRKEREFADLV